MLMRKTSAPAANSSAIVVLSDEAGPSVATTTTILEAFRPDTEPTRDVASSPFVFGGTDPIDPRVLSGLDVEYGSERDRERQQRRLQEEQSEDLGGLY
jgi:hypothetical protein